MKIGKRNLYRNVREGKIAGVCAGLADFFDVDAWLVRIAVLTVFFMGGGIIFPLYLAAWLVLDPCPDEEFEAREYKSSRKFSRGSINLDSDEGRRRFGQRTGDVMNTLEDRFAEMEQRLQQMEGFVTSSKYKLHRAFRDLNKR